MRIEFLKLMFFITFLSGIGNSSEDVDNTYVYKPQAAKITVNELIADLAQKPSVITLDLSGHPEVNDLFIETLSNDEKSRRIVNMDLSGTSITDLSLSYILLNKVGTIRDLPQINAKYESYASEIGLNLKGTTVTKTNFSKPVSNVNLEYKRSDGKKTAENKTGIKILNFNK